MMLQIELNSCGFELVILHSCFFLQLYKLRVIADGAMKEEGRRQLIGIAPVYISKNFHLIFTATNKHDVERFIVQRERPSPA